MRTETEMNIQTRVQNGMEVASELKAGNRLVDAIRRRSAPIANGSNCGESPSTNGFCSDYPPSVNGAHSKENVARVPVLLGLEVLVDAKPDPHGVRLLPAGPFGPRPSVHDRSEVDARQCVA